MHQINNYIAIIQQDVSSKANLIRPSFTLRFATEKSSDVVTNVNTNYIGTKNVTMPLLIKFATLEKAIEYCKKNNYRYIVLNENEQSIVIKPYSNNFTKSKS